MHILGKGFCQSICQDLNIMALYHHVRPQLRQPFFHAHAGHSQQTGHLIIRTLGAINHSALIGPCYGHQSPVSPFAGACHMYVNTLCGGFHQCRFQYHRHDSVAVISAITPLACQPTAINDLLQMACASLNTLVAAFTYYFGQSESPGKHRPDPGLKESANRYIGQIRPDQYS